jgi:glutathione S-transferase
MRSGISHAPYHAFFNPHRGTFSHGSRAVQEVAMSTNERVVLRYFPVLGRAQAIRHILADRQVPFEDVRPTMADWGRERENASYSGPFRALPSLTWGDAHVSETLPVASFIAKRTGQYDGLDDAAIARIEAICSCCLMDVVLRVAELLRVDQVYPGSDAARAIVVLAPRVLQKLATIDADLGAAEWFGGAQPVTADFFAVEAFEAFAYAVGPTRRAALGERLPRLTSLSRRVRERPAQAKAFETRPARLTPRPEEDAILERARAADLSALRL